MLLIQMIDHREICPSWILENGEVNLAYGPKNIYWDLFQKYENCSCLLGWATRTWWIMNQMLSSYGLRHFSPFYHLHVFFVL